VRPSDPSPQALHPDYVVELKAIASAHGITHTGVAPASVMQRARDALFERRDAGLHDGMAFTYKNPQRSTDPGRAVHDARSVFVGARPYSMEDPGDASPIAVGARVARYAWTDHYVPLREGLRAVALRLRADGWKAVAFADDNSMVDREAAHLAGLGWFGKNANLLLSGAGSYFVLGSVVTTAPLPFAAAVVADGCGSCRRCVDACPTGAIVRPGVVDAGRCLAWLLQKPGSFDRRFRRALGDRIYGCDDCQEVCPPTVRLGQRFEQSAIAEVEPRIDVLELLDSSDAELLRRWGRWYLTDRDPRWLRRNALVVLGNVGRPDPSVSPDARVIDTLARYLAHDDPVLRAHAVWAARSCGLEHLLPSSDPHPDVLAELSAPL
jgi:epoxyqueuosine reductase